MAIKDSKFRVHNFTLSLEKIPTEISVEVRLNFRVISTSDNTFSIELLLVLSAIINDQKIDFLNIKTTTDFEFYEITPKTDSEKENIIKTQAFPLIYAKTSDFINVVLKSAGANSITLPDFNTYQKQ